MTSTTPTPDDLQKAEELIAQAILYFDKNYLDSKSLRVRDELAQIIAAKRERDEIHQTLMNREKSLKQAGDDWVKAKEETDRVIAERDSYRDILDWIEENSTYNGGGNGGTYQFKVTHDSESMIDAIQQSQKKGS